MKELHKEFFQKLRKLLAEYKVDIITDEDLDITFNFNADLAHLDLYSVNGSLSQEYGLYEVWNHKERRWEDID